MFIIKNRKKIDFKEYCNTFEEFIAILNLHYDTFNLLNDDFIQKTKKVYEKLTYSSETTFKYTRLTRFLFLQFNFKYKNVKQLSFWIERGWSSEEAQIFINKNKKKSIDTLKSISKNRLESKLKISFEKNIDYEIRYKTAMYFTKTHPQCNMCNNLLILKKINKCNKIKEFYYKIIKCSNENCNSRNHITKNDLYKCFLPLEISKNHILKIKNKISLTNFLCIESWINKGYSIDEAKIEISKIQSKNSLLVKNKFVASKENLKKIGYTDEEIYEKTATPSEIRFWLKKGYNEEDAKIKVYENQKNASKNIDFNLRLLPTNIKYWTNKGLTEDEAKDNIKKRQSTFSLKKCIEKYGEKDGLIRFNERQFKWQKNLLKNGNLKCGYSLISQKLFQELILLYNKKVTNLIYFALKNKEYFLIDKLKKHFYQYDFVDLNQKKIIEYNGDKYHANPKLYKSEDFPHPFRKTITAQEIWNKDMIKNNYAIENGFEILIIWDSDYRRNPQQVIENCIKFLKL